MTDIAITWDGVNNRGDWTVSDGALGTGEDLYSAVLISLFTDGLAPDSYKIQDGTSDRRGVWFDSYESQNLGSLLWTLFRAKKVDSNTLLLQARDYCQAALQWLLDDQVINSLDVRTYWIGPTTIGVIINVTSAADAPMTFMVPYSIAPAVPSSPPAIAPPPPAPTVSIAIPGQANISLYALLREAIKVSLSGAGQTALQLASTVAASFAGVGSFAVSGFNGRAATFNAAGLGSIASFATANETATISLGGVGNLSAQYSYFAAPAGVGSVSIATLLREAAAATISGTGAVSLSTNIVKYSGVNLAGQGSVGVNAVVAAKGSAAIAGQGSITLALSTPLVGSVLDVNFVLDQSKLG